MSKYAEGVRPLGPWPIDESGTVSIPVLNRRASGPVAGYSLTLIDGDQYALAMSHSWRVDAYGYACSNANGKGLFLHRLVLRAPQGVLVDHINHDILDNRRAAMRLVDAWASVVNRRLRQGPHTSRFHGVHWDKQRQAWRAMVRFRGRQIYGGCFTTEELAAAAYDKLIVSLRPEISPPNASELEARV